MSYNCDRPQVTDPLKYFNGPRSVSDKRRAQSLLRFYRRYSGMPDIEATLLKAIRRYRGDFKLARACLRHAMRPHLTVIKGGRS